MEGCRAPDTAWNNRGRGGRWPGAHFRIGAPFLAPGSLSLPPHSSTTFALMVPSHHSPRLLILLSVLLLFATACTAAPVESGPGQDGGRSEAERIATKAAARPVTYYTSVVAFGASYTGMLPATNEHSPVPNIVAQTTPTHALLSMRHRYGTTIHTTVREVGIPMDP